MAPLKETLRRRHTRKLKRVRKEKNLKHSTDFVLFLISHWYITSVLGYSSSDHLITITRPNVLFQQLPFTRLLLGTYPSIWKVKLVLSCLKSLTFKGDWFSLRLWCNVVIWSVGCGEDGKIGPGERLSHGNMRYWNCRPCMLCFHFICPTDVWSRSRKSLVFKKIWFTARYVLVMCSLCKKAFLFPLNWNWWHVSFDDIFHWYFETKCMPQVTLFIT